MKKLVCLLFIGFTLSACEVYQEVQFGGVKGVHDAQPADGKINLVADLKVDNPNNYKIKVKPATMDVFINDRPAGVAFLQEPVTLLKRTDTIYAVKLAAQLKNINLFSLAQMALGGGKVKVTLKGIVKASAIGVTKKINVNESRMIDLADFNDFIHKGKQ